MNRRSLLKMMVILPLLPSCINSNNPSNANYALPLEIREITSDTVLTEDTIGVQYNVHPNVTLNCSGVILDGAVGANMTAVIFAQPNSVIIEPTIVNARTGINLVPYNHKEVWEQLEYLSEEDGMSLVNANRGSGHQRVVAGNFTNCKVGCYVHALNVGAEITQSTFARNRLSVYLDAYSTQTLVQSNEFHRQGSGWKDKSLGWFAAGRESIAIDGSSDNIIDSNTFDISTRKAFIEIYKNCGENNIPRWEGSINNTIKDNTFNSGSIGIWVSSRRDDRKTHPCRADDSGDVVVDTKLSHNTFSSVDVGIVDHGDNTLIT